MPWKDVRVDEQRLRFVLRASSGAEEMSGLCREFGISRPTGYLWLKRFQESGRIEEVRERSRRPQQMPGKTSAEIEAQVVRERRQRPDWGPKKLRALLKRNGTELGRMTVHRILQRHHLILPHRSHPPALQRFERTQPNELWQMDFKGLPANLSQGWTPLSVLDDCSRYSLGLKGLRGTGGDLVRSTLEGIFRESGLPDGMLVDHGTPWWNAQHPCGWTTLSIWLMKQNIRLHFSAVRHPQTQGKVERFHRSLEDALHERGFPAGRGEWPEWLEEFRQEYNHVRPHEALGMQVPASRWQPSQRSYLEKLPEWEYPAGSQLMTVRQSGQIKIGKKEYTITRALAGEVVELRPLIGDRSLVFYRRTCIREIDFQKRQSYPVYFSREQPIFAD
jgi:transposase InsO family protein